MVPPDIGTAACYGVLARVDVLNAGVSQVNGNVGTAVGTITGFPPGIITNGVQHAADANANTAWNSLFAATTALFALGCDFAIAGSLNGLTILPRKNCATTSLTLTTSVTFDAQGNAGAGFYIQASSPDTITIGPGATMILINGASQENIYIRGTSISIAAGAVVFGNFIGTSSASTAILATSATVNGRLFTSTALGGGINMTTTNVVNGILSPPCT